MSPVLADLTMHCWWVFLWSYRVTMLVVMRTVIRGREVNRTVITST